MQYLVLSRRRTDLFSEVQFAPLVEAEQQGARELYSEGFIRQIWHRGDMGGACLLVEASSEKEVRENLTRLPFVQKEMLEIVNIVPLRPYAGFGPRKL